MINTHTFTHVTRTRPRCRFTLRPNCGLTTGFHLCRASGRPLPSCIAPDGRRGALNCTASSRWRWPSCRDLRENTATCLFVYSQQNGLRVGPDRGLTCEHEGVGLGLYLLVRQASSVLILPRERTQIRELLFVQFLRPDFFFSPTSVRSMMSTKSFFLCGADSVPLCWPIRARRFWTTSLVNLQTPHNYQSAVQADFRWVATNRSP